MDCDQWYQMYLKSKTINLGSRGINLYSWKPVLKTCRNFSKKVPFAIKHPLIDQAETMQQRSSKIYMDELRVTFGDVP